MRGRLCSQLLEHATHKALPWNEIAPASSVLIVHRLQVNQDRQTGEQLQEQNEAKQYSAQAAGAPASEVAKMVDEVCTTKPLRWPVIVHSRSKICTS